MNLCAESRELKYFLYYHEERRLFAIAFFDNLLRDSLQQTEKSAEFALIK